MKTIQKFKVGDYVKWESSGKEKKGRVVKIIPERMSFFNCRLKHFTVDGFYEHEKYNKTRLSDGKPRDHESYLVLVDEKYLYWPRVGLLKKEGV